MILFTSTLVCHMSYVRCQVSHARCHMSLYWFFLLLNLKSCRASWWRVCYQPGLPRLVLTQSNTVYDVNRVQFTVYIHLTLRRKSKPVQIYTRAIVLHPSTTPFPKPSQSECEAFFFLLLYHPPNFYWITN